MTLTITLVLHDAPAEEETKAFFERLREMDLKQRILSNNGKERVEQFASKVGAMYYREHAGKPSAKAYLDAAETLDTDRKKMSLFRRPDFLRIYLEETEQEFLQFWFVQWEGRSIFILF